MASTITDIGTDNSEHMEMIASEVKAGKDPIVNFNQDSKVIVKHMESPDTQNNSTKSGINDALSTTVPLKIRNKPERLFTVNVISSDDPLLTTLTHSAEMLINRAFVRIRRCRKRRTRHWWRRESDR